VSPAPTAPYESHLFRQVTGPALRPGGLDLTKQALDWCGFKPGDRLLDLGCGLGASASHMAWGRDLRVLGLDLSAAMLEESKRSYQGLALIRADIQCIPLGNACLDGVLCECVLSLAENPQSVLNECSRVLKPGAKLIVSDLYLRHPAPDGTGPGAPGCLGGARGRDDIEAMVSASGLEILLWEDHSRLLRQLAARLVWQHGSLDGLWPSCSRGDTCGANAARARQTKPGYFLMAVQRKAESQG
jgi:arsenite methyltransferase